MAWFGLTSGMKETRTDSILVGSDPDKVNMVLEDPQVLSVHAEIYGKLEEVAGGQMVTMYISTLNGGMIRIIPDNTDLENPNYPWTQFDEEELRPGDRIIVGPYQIRVIEVQDPNLEDEESPYDFEIEKIY